MKADIHPKYYPEAQVKCACGNTFTLGSTREALEVEVCSACHPFYTGNEKVIDTAGRVEKFKARTEAAKKARAAKTPTKTSKAGSSDQPKADLGKAKKASKKEESADKQ